MGIFGLIFLVCVLVYLPPVQKFAIGKVSGIVENSTGMRLSVEKFRLRFPLGVSVAGATLITPAGDTLVAFDRFKADVSLLPLVAGDVRVGGISLENASATYRDTVSAMLLRARIDAFAVRGANLHLKTNSVRISRAALDGADVTLDMGEAVPVPDTAAVDTTSSAAWKFRLRRFDLSDVKFAMTTSPNESLVSVDLPYGTIRRADVDLGEQNIGVKLIRLADGDYGYFTGNTAAVDKPAAPESDPAADALPWTVKVGSVELADNKAAYGSMYGTPASGLDFEHIRADSIELLVEDVYYRGSDISASLRKLELSERSGLRVTRGRADFSMTGRGISLKDLDLATANSEIRADAEVGAGIMDMAASTPVEATLSAAVGTGDVFLLVPLDGSAKRALRGQSLALDGDFRGTLGNLSIDKLAAEMPGRIEFNARGNVRSINAPENLAGEVSFDGSMRRLGFVKGFIADTALKRRIGFPRRMTLRGDVAFSPDEYNIPGFTLTADSGRLDLKGRLGVRNEDFDADVRFTDFPLHRFLPHDSLGVATLSLTAHGQGFDPFGGMSADADVEIEHVDYNGFAYRDMALVASLADSKLAGRLTSSNEALSLDLGIDGILERGRYEAGVEGDIWRADLHRMGFSENTLAVTTRLDINGAALRDTTKMRFRLDAAIDSTVVRFGSVSQRIDLTTIKASAVDTLTTAAIRSGDLTVDFSSPLSLDSLAARLGTMGNEISKQLTAKDLSVDSLQMVLPDMQLKLSAGRGNVLRELARMENMDFRHAAIDISTVQGRPLRINGEVNGLRTAGLTLDTLSLRVGSRGDRLRYALRLANRPGNIESLALIYVYGNAGGNEASLNVYQRNRADSVGFRFGLNAQLLKNSVRAVMTPAAPTLGYEKWSVNDGNYIEYAFDGRFAADLHLKGPADGKHIDITSASMQGIPEGALRLAMGGIDIGNLIDLLPTAPPLGGIVSSDLTFGLHDRVMAAKGTLGVGDFMYNNRRVADIDAAVDFQSDGTGRMILDAGVDLEKRTALTAKGTYTKDNMDFTVTLPYVPLSAAEAFVGDMAKLSGSLDGNVAIQGPPSSPVMNGDVGFTGGKAEIGMIGTTYGISPDRLTIGNGLLAFNGFGIVAPNNRKLAIDGTVDISDFSKMKADLRVAANNFQAVNSTHLGGSQVYGKAALDIDITAKGPFDGLTVRGDVDLRQTTDVVYILRDQSKNVRDEKQDIVQFMVFADSLYTATAADTTARFRRGGMDLLVGVNIGDGLKATLALDELSENRVELQGGGELSYSMNSQGDMRLSGRYTLSGGKVYYKLPVISQKIFTVRDGSYVEWAGEPADPAFNVTAVLTQKVTLESEGGSSKDVSFDISIAISGSLQGIAITFDAAAPNDLEIQNELSTMSDEQRMQQALTLLIYNQYTGMAYSSQDASFDARDQVNKFLSKEINQWARNNLKGVDFSMGIDSKEDAAGNTHTDYSYSVSKSLFSDRVKITVGGSVSDNSTSAQELSENLVDDISLEYRLTKRDNMFLKVYQYNTQESILEGEITETGGGFVVRKKLDRFGDLFRLNRDEEKRQKRIRKREERKELRAEEKAVAAEPAGPEDAPSPGDPADPANVQKQNEPLQ